jgi:hypothetical protein
MFQTTDRDADGRRHRKYLLSKVKALKLIR